jgi:prevent-host-death family protein
MPDTYSTYDAKAKFSEILRKVRTGKTVYISYRGEVVAEIKPTEKSDSMEERIRRLEARGVITRRSDKRAPMKPIAKRPGAVKRFLEERD